MTGVSTLGQALAQMERLKAMNLQFSNLATQLSTGRKTQVFSGLGNDVVTSERARASFKSLDTYIANITHADRRIQLTSSAISEFRAQAQNFAHALVAFSQESAHQQGDVVTYDDPLTTQVETTQLGFTSDQPDVDLRTLQSLAESIYGFLVELINRKDGERYMLAGADNLNSPLTDTGSLGAAINSLLDDWRGGVIDNDQLISGLHSRDATQDPNAITDTTVGYSPALANGTARGVFVRIDDNSEIDYTALANDQSFRDIIVAISWFKSGNLGPIADQVDPDTLAVVTEGAPGDDVAEMKENFYAVFNNMTAMLNQALDNLEAVEFKIESARARITETKLDHQQQKNVLLGAISDVENINIDEVAVKLNALQIQMDASYRITARMQELSLVNFLFT
jgi:flagellar hook-associated protein 3 FlgL